MRRAMIAAVLFVAVIGVALALLDDAALGDELPTAHVPTPDETGLALLSL
jgi:hypothetical protein